MNAKLCDGVLFLGVLGFVVGAALMVLGSLEPSGYLAVLGLIIIGAGASGKQCAS